MIKMGFFFCFKHVFLEDEKEFNKLDEKNNVCLILVLNENLNSEKMKKKKRTKLI